jgi:hypothetical protein
MTAVIFGSLILAKLYEVDRKPLASLAFLGVAFVTVATWGYLTLEAS